MTEECKKWINDHSAVEVIAVVTGHIQAPFALYIEIERFVQEAVSVAMCKAVGR